MHKTVIPMFAAALVVASSAIGSSAPVVSDVTFDQDRFSREVAITYRISTEAAIVTLDIETNAVNEAGEIVWASIGATNLWSGFSADSDVWRKVSGKDVYTIKWLPYQSWFGHKVPPGGVRAKVTAWALDNPPDYLVIGDLSSTGTPESNRFYPSVEFLPGGLLDDVTYRTERLVLRKIHARNVKFQMGCIYEDNNGSTDDAAHTAYLSADYYMGVFEVTQKQWFNVQGSYYNGTYFSLASCRDTRPADSVSYNLIRQANATGEGYDYPAPPWKTSFLGNLSSRSGLDCDLPTEAQWEYACRAGWGDGRWNDGSFYSSAWSGDDIARVARYYYNSSTGGAEMWNYDDTKGTAKVGSYEPNSWGLYDLHGNVAEWCLDWYEADITGLNGAVNMDVNDGSKTRSGATGTVKVIRGGDWATGFGYRVRSAARMSQAPNTGNYANGFRVCCPAVVK